MSSRWSCTRAREDIPRPLPPAAPGNRPSRVSPCPPSASAKRSSTSYASGRSPTRPRPTPSVPTSAARPATWPTPPPPTAPTSRSPAGRGTSLLRTKHAAAAPMTGEPDPARAAAALVDAGARLGVVTLGAEGAVLRGEHEADVPGVPARVRSTVGAGDALMGLLLARAARSGFAPAAVADALPDAVAEAARATERWGAVA